MVLAKFCTDHRRQYSLQPLDGISKARSPRERQGQLDRSIVTCRAITPALSVVFIHPVQSPQPTTGNLPS